MAKQSDTNLELYLHQILDNIDANLAAQSGGSTATVKPGAMASFYDTTGNRTLFAVSFSDGSAKAFTDAKLTTEATGTITPGPEPAGGVAASKGTVAAALAQSVTLSTENVAKVDLITAEVAKVDATIKALAKTSSEAWVKDSTNDNIVLETTVFDPVTGLSTKTYKTPAGTAYTLVGNAGPHDADAPASTLARGTADANTLRTVEADILVTPGFDRAVADGATPAGAVLLSFFNAGPDDVTVGGKVLKTDEALDYPPAAGLRYNPIAYTVPAATTLLIQTATV